MMIGRSAAWQMTILDVAHGHISDERATCMTATRAAVLVLGFSDHSIGQGIMFNTLQGPPGAVHLGLQESNFSPAGLGGGGGAGGPAALSRSIWDQKALVMLHS